MARHESAKAGIPAIVVTGPVGAGKSTVGWALSNLLEAAGIRNFFVDMDYLRRLSPQHAHDRHAVQLGYRNLAAIWPNLLDDGATCVILADVVEDMAQRGDYTTAMPGSNVCIVRLDVPLDLVADRIRAREGDEAAWSLNRAPELQGIMEERQIGDLVIDVGSRSPVEVAIEIARRLDLASSPLAQD